MAKYIKQWYDKSDWYSFEIYFVFFEKFANYLFCHLNYGEICFKVNLKWNFYIVVSIH